VGDPQRLEFHLGFAIRLVTIEALEREAKYERRVGGEFALSRDDKIRRFEAQIGPMLTSRIRSLVRAARKKRRSPAVEDAEQGVDNSSPVSATTELDSTSKPVLARRRVSALRSVTSKRAAEKVAVYIQRGGLTQMEFATKAGTTPRTLHTFLKTGKVKITIFEAIARAINMDKESLLKEYPE
jgi:hypothetical protein